jgi:predicted RNase H-like HicB family nuclease
MIRETAVVRYRVVLEQDEAGMYVAEIPALPGCVSQGGTREEAVRNVREAAVGYLESLRAHNEPIPPGAQEEFIDLP